jgi:hypothetical protein
MTVARSVADVLGDYVVFEVGSMDRMYLNVWQPRLAYGGGVQGFFVGHRGHHYVSTALMDPMTKAFVAGIRGFIGAEDFIVDTGHECRYVEQHALKVWAVGQNRSQQSTTPGPSTSAIVLNRACPMVTAALVKSRS